MMFLTGGNISLRAMEPSDAALLYEWENNMSLWPVSSTQVPFSRHVLEQFSSAPHQDIYTNRQLRLMVDHREKKVTVGAIDLYEFDPQHLRCGIGIYIHTDHRREGVAAECIELVKKYCFSTLMLNQVFATVNAGNTASLALFEKSGFQRSGLKKSWTRHDMHAYEDAWFLQCFNGSPKSPLD